MYPLFEFFPSISSPPLTNFSLISLLDPFLSFPIAKKQASAGELPAIAPEKEYRAWRTLVIDDNFNNLEFATALLDKMGFSCQTASDAEEAFAVMEDVHFDLILVDMMMPGIDGCELTRQIRAHERAANTPPILIAAVSAGTENSVRQKAFQAGTSLSLLDPC